MSTPPVGGPRPNLSVNSDLPPSDPANSSGLQRRGVSQISLNSVSSASNPRDARPSRQQEPLPPNAEGAGVNLTPPRDEHKAEANQDGAGGVVNPPGQGLSRRARKKRADREAGANGWRFWPWPGASAGAGGAAGSGDGWRFWRWIGRDKPRPAAASSSAPASANGPPPNWLDWMRSPLSDPIPPKAPQPKLGLADFPWQPKKDDLEKTMADKAQCLEPLADLFMYRDTLLKSMQSALRANFGKDELLEQNKSEFEKAMKQELAFKELCDFCLNKYIWKPWPEKFYPDALVKQIISLEEQALIEKLHKECITKNGDLDRLEGSLLADLQKKKLYALPKTPAKPTPADEALVEKVLKFLGKHPWLTAGAVGSFLFAVRDLSWMPVSAPITVGISIDGAGEPQELAKDIKELAKTVFKSSASAALPIGGAIATTAYLNDCEYFLSLGSYNFLTPGQLFGLAGITNLIAISNFMEGVNWVLDELPSICSEKITRIPYVIFRGGYRTGIASAALGGALSNYFDASKTVTVSFMAMIWATHVAASYAIYQSELRNSAV